MVEALGILSILVIVDKLPGRMLLRSSTDVADPS
jgi:hypothetical protein